jgi:hypothetical protein
MLIKNFNNQIFIKSALVSFFFALVGICTPVLVFAQNFYVSPTGSDSASGNEQNPFKTLQKAKHAVTKINKDMTGDITVYLREGTHNICENVGLAAKAKNIRKMKRCKSFTLTPKDSGRNGFNVIYKNYPGETPIISSGKEVTSWEMHDQSLNIYKAYVGTTFYSRHLFINGKRAKRAGSINVSNESFILDANNGFTLPSSGFYADMAKWQNPSDIEIRQNKVWTTQWGSIKSIAGGLITMKEDFWRATRHYAQWGIGMDGIDFIENAYELLDEAGEWYLDRTSGFLYYKPTSDQTDLSALSFILPRLDVLIKGNPKGSVDKTISNIKFEGLTFSHTTSLQPLTNEGRVGHQAGVLFFRDANLVDFEDLSISAVHFKYSNNIEFDNCQFLHLGTAGVAFDIGSQQNTINNSTFDDISDNGISIGNIDAVNYNPSNVANRVTNHMVSNNIISKVGQDMTDSVGIFGGYVNNLMISHNTLSDLPYTPISVGWGWGAPDETGTYSSGAVGSNSIISNRITNYMNVNHDGGGIYTLGRQDNSSIKFNYISGQKNVYTYIYLDNGSEFFTVENNVISSEAGSISDWLMATNDVGDIAYHASNYNTIRNNFYSSELNTFRCYDTNICGMNIAVKGSDWPDYAQEVMTKAGANNGEVLSHLPEQLQIWGKYNEMVFTPQNGSTVVGTYVVQSVNTGADNQKWQLVLVDDQYYVLKNVATGLVVAPEGNSAVAGIPLVLTTDNGNHSQHWSFEFSEKSDSSGQIVLKNRASGFVITPSGFSGASDTVLIQYTDTLNNMQAWAVSENLDIPGPAVGDYYQISGQNNLVLSPSDPNAPKGSGVVQETVTNLTSQQWQLIDIGNGYSKIQHKASGWVLTPSGHSSSAGTTIILWEDDGNLDQQWNIITNGNSSVIENRASGLVITPAGHSATSGAALILWSAGGNISQNWTLNYTQ